MSLHCCDCNANAYNVPKSMSSLQEGTRHELIKQVLLHNVVISIMIFTLNLFDIDKQFQDTPANLGKSSLWSVSDVILVESDHIDDVEIVETDGQS